MGPSAHSGGRSSVREQYSGAGSVTTKIFGNRLQVRETVLAGVLQRDACKAYEYTLLGVVNLHRAHTNGCAFRHKPLGTGLGSVGVELRDQHQGLPVRSNVVR